MNALSEAANITNEILQMTRTLVISGVQDAQDAEVEAYAALMEKRKPLIARLNELHMDAEMSASSEFAQLRKVIEQITDLDKKHLAYMEQIRADVQKTHKGIKNQQKLMHVYSELPDDTVSRSFDVKQ
jgi:hypothetical protein